MNRKQFFIIAIITFITICAWVLFDVLHTRAAVELPSQLQEAIQPLDPNFDLSAVE